MSPGHIILGGTPTWEETTIKERKDSGTDRRVECGNSTGAEAFHRCTQSRWQVAEVMMDSAALSCKDCTSWQGLLFTGEEATLWH